MASFIRWATTKMGWDAYHAMASYTTAEPVGLDALGKTKFQGKRDHKNVQRLKTFWLDIDVKRPGDKKAAGRVYLTRIEAMKWLKTFLVATQLPPPNLAIDSGYGMHVYWVLEDELTLGAWQPYADALKAALIATGFLGDPGISADAARVLRPPGSANQKSGAPMPVQSIPRIVAGDYPNALILNALQPWVGLQTARGAQVAQGAAQAQGTAQALGGGGAAVQGIFAGRATPNMAQAAQANVTTSRPRFMSRIATRCEQLKLSLANHGKDEDRGLWLLGNLTLAHFCEDGADYVHLVGDGDRRYTVAGTDAAVAQIAAEHLTKGMGPPRCTHYETHRQSVCVTCPHYTKINSPWDLGTDDGDLPENYRRGARGLELRIKAKDDVFWIQLLAGDVHTPVLDELPLGGYALTFIYERVPGRAWTVRVTGSDLTATTLFDFFQRQFLWLSPGCEAHFRGFILGWIDKLRENRAERTEIIHPFGWSRDAQGKLIGFAVGGTLYTPAGLEIATPGGDATLVAAYKPMGTLANWQQAAQFVMQNRVDLQVLVAASFGAPLMIFTGHAGLVVSAWSRQSAVGKSSSIRVGQSVWSAAISMNSIDDTNNFVLKKVSDVRCMPCYWDEMKVGSENSDKMVSLALSLSQGKGKGRMNADTSLKEVGEWDTILIAASNFPLMDHIVAKTDGTDAGAVRLFEFGISRPPEPDTSHAARTIALTKTNYGVAGRTFAKWIAANSDKADKIVCLIKDQLNTELKAEQSERFYIAGMAAMLAGARIAAHIGIVRFDLDYMRDYLCLEFDRMRAARRLSVVVSAEGYDLQQILGQFMADTLQHKLVTQWFNAPGKPRLPADWVRWYPTDRRRVDVHIAQEDAIMRINRGVFNTWSRKKNYAPSDIITALEHIYGAVCGRRSIGGGTGFSTQVYCIDIPLRLPELVDYIHVDAAAAAINNQQPASSKPASPGAGLKGAAGGSRPKV